MLQQTALLLLAGLIFLFFYTPNYEESFSASGLLIILLSILFTILPAILLYVSGRIITKRFSNAQTFQIQILNHFSLLFGVLALFGFIFEVYCLKINLFISEILSFWKFNNSRTFISIFPYVIAIILIKMVLFELERKIRGDSSKLKKALKMNLKLMLFPTLPFIVGLLIADVIEHSPLSLRIFFISHSYLYWIIMVIVLITSFIKAPVFIKHIWQTYPLPQGTVRDRIERLADKQNIKFRDILIWNLEGGKIANAGIAGLLPKSRYIFITDSLLSNFTEDEIETIVAHEFGHIKYKHVLFYLFFSIGYIILYTFLYTLTIPISEKLQISNIISNLLNAFFTLIFFCAYFVIIFRYLSRKFEIQSDIFALDITKKPQSFKNALIKLSSINYIPKTTSKLISIFRTHPSVYQRLELINKFILGVPEISMYRKPIFSVNRVSIGIVILLTLIMISKNHIFSPEKKHYEIGMQYAIEGMIDEAIEHIRESVKYNPESFDAFYALGILYAKKGNVEVAIQELKKALEINPSNTAAREKLNQIESLSK